MREEEKYMQIARVLCRCGERAGGALAALGVFEMLTGRNHFAALCWLLAVGACGVVLHLDSRIQETADRLWGGL